MDALTATATAVATLSGCSSGDDKPIDRSWPDGSGRLPPSATARYGSSSSGYAVVDPMPMPSRCTRVAAKDVEATAVGTMVSAGKLELAVKLVARATEPLEITKYIGGSTLVSLPVFKPESGGASVVMVVDPSSGKTLYFTVGVKCGAEEAHLDLTVDLTPPYAVTIPPYQR